MSTPKWGQDELCKHDWPKEFCQICYTRRLEEKIKWLEKTIKWLEAYMEPRERIAELEAERSNYDVEVHAAYRELEKLRAENQRLREAQVWLYNQGYMSGHHDTVEGQFTDVLPVDMETYHDDVVADLLEGRGDE